MDLNVKRNEYVFRLPLLHYLVRDPRDFPLIQMWGNVVLTTIPSALLVYLDPVFGPLYWLGNLILWQERWVLGQHFTAHRQVLRWRILDHIFLTLVSPFFGIPYWQYYLHHVIMHHRGNNRHRSDLSSTEPYQRDNLLHFLHYWLRFLFCIWVELPLYAWRKRRYDQMIYALLGSFGYFLLLAYLDCQPTFWVFWLPLLSSSLTLMFGNWSQHIFIDPTRTKSAFGNSYSCINTPSNQRSFNDGYHTEHHLKPDRHWSELPSSFARKIQLYQNEDAIVFQGIDFFSVGFLVFQNNWENLLDHMVTTRPRTREEKKRRLIELLRPITGDSGRAA